MAKDFLDPRGNESAFVYFWFAVQLAVLLVDLKKAFVGNTGAGWGDGGGTSTASSRIG
jgi:hypothetical protein